MSFAIGSVQGSATCQWQVVGYLCTGDGIQIVGNYIVDGKDAPGRECREWFIGFNRTEKEVWAMIDSLPISLEAKRELGEKGMYPSHLLDVVGLAHDNWRRSIGKAPDYHFARMVRGTVKLKMPCPFT